MNEILTIINSNMDELGLNYEFDRMTQSPPSYPYWVGDYTEPEPMTEDGEEQISFFLTGFARNNIDLFENQKQLIKDHFKHGVYVNTNSGSAVVVFFGGIVNIPIEDVDLRKCQITLQIKFWKGQ